MLTLQLQSWERTTTEPLHIYSQFAALIRQRLAFRHQKHVQFELVQEALETQKDKLDLLEAAEKESRRLEDALDRGNRTTESMSAEQMQEEREQDRERERERQERVERAQKRANSFGLLSAVKHSLSGMMDVDPEATRRANIAKTRDNISQVSCVAFLKCQANVQLEDSLQASEQDLKYASMTLQADLDRFQRQKVADLRTMTIQLSKVHRDWCQQVSTCPSCKTDDRTSKYGELRNRLSAKSSLIRINHHSKPVPRPLPTSKSPRRPQKRKG